MIECATPPYTAAFELVAYALQEADGMEAAVLWAARPGADWSPW
jgi:hypothetical protein